MNGNLNIDDLMRRIEDLRIFPEIPSKGPYAEWKKKHQVWLDEKSNTLNTIFELTDAGTHHDEVMQLNARLWDVSSLYREAVSKGVCSSFTCQKMLIILIVF